MRTYPFSLSVVAAALVLGACATPEAYTTMRPVDYVVAQPSAVAGGTAPSVVVAPAPAYAATSGGGRVESLVAVPRDGGTMWRVGVRMDDGSVRTVDTLIDGIMVGNRVQLDHDGRLALARSDAVIAAVPATRSAAAGSSSELGETRWVAPRSGFGRVESLTAVANNAGFTGSDGRPHVSVWRIGVRMDDGTHQVMDSPASGLALGSRIRITSEGNIARAD
jgi:hypothetical protein